MNHILRSIRVYVVFSALLGLIYPLTVMLVAQATMPYKANGSLMTRAGAIAGSTLIGQEFTRPAYFLGRPSAAGYDAANSGASNAGPSSAKLMGVVSARIERCRVDNGVSGSIPADMVLASASGLDPHISIENARYQAARVATLRGIPPDIVHDMIRRNTDPDFIGLWGRPGVNVLELNAALDTYR